MKPFMDVLKLSNLTDQPNVIHAKVAKYALEANLKNATHVMVKEQYSLSKEVMHLIWLVMHVVGQAMLSKIHVQLVEGKESQIRQ